MEINKIREHEQNVKYLVLKEYAQFKGIYNERGMRTLLICYVHGLTELGLYMFDPVEVTRYISHLVEREGK